MADYTITASHVAWLGGTPVQWGVSGDTIAAGETVALNSSSRLVRADSTLIADDHVFKGIALAGATTGQPIPYAIAGASIRLNNGGSVDVTSQPIFLSETAGKLMPHTDITAGFAGVPVFIGFLYPASLRENILLQPASAVWVWSD